MANHARSPTPPAANSQHGDQPASSPQFFRQETWGFIEMAPPRGRRGGATPSPRVRNHSPSGSSARTGSDLRRPADIRSPLVAKYSTSYGSTLTKLPDRHNLVSSGNISRAAATVFQQVKKDNQASEIRRANQARAAQAVPAVPAVPAAPAVRQESIASSTSRSAATSASESDQVDQVKQANRIDSVSDAFQAAAEKARLKRQQDAAKAQADAEKARRELERQARKRARDDEEAEAEAERQRVERDARLRRERSAEAQARANLRATQTRPTTRAQSRPQSQSQSQARDLGNSQSQSQSQPQTQLSGATLMDSFPATPSAATGLRPSRTYDSARSFVEESRILDELEVLTPQSRASDAPLEPRVRRIVKTESSSAGAPSSLLPAHSKRLDRPGPFVPAPRPTKSVQPNQQSRATPPTTSSPDNTQRTTRSAAAASGQNASGISSSRSRPASAAVNNEVEASASVSYPDTDDDQVIELIPNPEQRPNPREDENQRRGLRTEHYDGDTIPTTEMSRSDLRRRKPSRKTVDPNNVTPGWRFKLTPSWKDNMVPTGINPVKLLLILSLGFAILQVLFALFRFLSDPNVVPPLGQLDKFKHWFNDPSRFPDAVRQGLESSLPVMIHVNRDGNGKLVIDDEFWHAIRDRIKSDDSVLSLDEDSPLSDAQWQLLKDRLHFDDNTKPRSTSWENWLASNKRKVAKVLAEDVAESMKESVVTRDEFVKWIEDAFAKHRGTWEADLAQLRGRFADLLEIVQAKEAKLQGMSSEETSRLVEKLVRNAISNTQLDHVAKTRIGSARVDWELRGCMNYFAPGNGALVDVSLSSPNYVTSSSQLWWPFQISSHGRILNNPKLAALFEWDEPGNCWCAAIIGSRNVRQSADIGVKLAGFVIPQYVVLEHINPKITLNPKSMPKDMEVWAQFDEDNEQRILDWSSTQFPSTYNRGNTGENLRDQKTIQQGFHKIGEFTYEYVPEEEGIMVHKLSPELINLNAATDIVLVKAKTNYGADHTCFYRIRLYGKPVELIEPVAPTVGSSKMSRPSGSKTTGTTTSWKRSFWDNFLGIPDSHVSARQRGAGQEKKEEAEKARLETQAETEAAAQEQQTTQVTEELTTVTTTIPKSATTSRPKQGWFDGLLGKSATEGAPDKTQTSSASGRWWMPFKSRSSSKGEEDGEWVTIYDEVEIEVDEGGNEIIHDEHEGN